MKKQINKQEAEKILLSLINGSASDGQKVRQKLKSNSKFYYNYLINYPKFCENRSKNIGDIVTISKEQRKFERNEIKRKISTTFSNLTVQIKEYIFSSFDKGYYLKKRFKQLVTHKRYYADSIERGVFSLEKRD